MLIISVPVNPSCSCLLSLGGLYIDSAYYQPQTIAAPIIIHLGPQDLFWPRQCTETGLGNSLDLLFNPSPLLNSVSASQLLRRCSPGLRHSTWDTAAILKAIWRRKHLGQHSVKSTLGLSEEEPVAETSTQKTSIKHKAILLLPTGNLNVFPSQTGVWNGFCWIQTDHQYRHIHNNVNDCM